LTFQVLDFWKHPLFNSRQKNLKITLSTPTTAKLWYQDQRTSYWVWFFRALPKLLLVICIKHFQSKSAIAKFWKRQVYLWLPIWKRANNKNNNRFLFGAEKQLDVDIPSKTKFTTIIIIISFKLHPPSIKSNILTKTSFYGQKNVPAKLFKEMLTNTQGELHGAQKETNFWHFSDFDLFGNFQKREPAAFLLNGNNLNTLLLILSNNKNIYNTEKCE